jgi:hypothetical protein
MSRKSFILHLDSLEVFNELTNEQAGILFKAIKSYNEGKEFELDFALKLAFLPFKKQFERDSEKYQSVVERNKNNGSKGGRPKNPKEPKKSEKTHSVFKEPKKADNDNDSDSDNDNKNDNVNEIPTFDLFFHFLTEKYIELNLVAEKYRYEWKLKYDSWVVNGWKDGNGKQIKNWKSKALNTLKWINPKEEKPTYYEMPL